MNGTPLFGIESALVVPLAYMGFACNWLPRYPDSRLHGTSRQYMASFTFGFFSGYVPDPLRITLRLWYNNFRILCKLPRYALYIIFKKFNLSEHQTKSNSLSLSLLTTASIRVSESCIGLAAGLELDETGVVTAVPGLGVVQVEEPGVEGQETEERGVEVDVSEEIQLGETGME